MVVRGDEELAQPKIRARYAAIARSGLSSRARSIAEAASAFEYSADDLQRIPVGANLGLSCGNPVRRAALQAGETVVDLGCGGGIDVFLAAAQVGASGLAVGVDVTPEMITLARQNARAASELEPQCVAFYLSTMDRVPLRSGVVDCVISNSAIHMAQDKPAVFAEIYRILKPGGRLRVSDIALRSALSADVRRDASIALGWVPTANTIQEYAELLDTAGFVDVSLRATGVDLNVYARLASDVRDPSRESPGEKSAFAERLGKYDMNQYALAVDVGARKPERA